MIDRCISPGRPQAFFQVKKQRQRAHPSIGIFGSTKKKPMPPPPRGGGVDSPTATAALNTQIAFWFWGGGIPFKSSDFAKPLQTPYPYPTRGEGSTRPPRGAPPHLNQEVIDRCIATVRLRGKKRGQGLTPRSGFSVYQTPYRYPTRGGRVDPPTATARPRARHTARNCMFQVFPGSSLSRRGTFRAAMRGRLGKGATKVG